MSSDEPQPKDPPWSKQSQATPVRMSADGPQRKLLAYAARQYWVSLLASSREPELISQVLSRCTLRTSSSRIEIKPDPSFSTHFTKQPDLQSLGRHRTTIKAN